MTEMVGANLRSGGDSEQEKRGLSRRKAMGLIKTLAVIPLLVSGLYLIKADSGVSSAGLAGPAALVQVTDESGGGQDLPKGLDTGESELEREVIARRMRIERIMMALDYVAEVTLQMHPDQIDAVEPVIVDLAEQTLELTSVEAVLDEATDEDLDQLETTVDDLVLAIERYVEPEMNL
jgi:hypothetical protein